MKVRSEPDVPKLVNRAMGDAHDASYRHPRRWPNVLFASGARQFGGRWLMRQRAIGVRRNRWPERIPVKDAEVDVFEAWFGDLFDELFGPCR